MKIVALCPGQVITQDLLAEKIIPYTTINNEINDNNASKIFPDMSLKEIERQHIIQVLESNNLHKGKTCEILGVSRPRLRRLITQYNLTRFNYQKY